MSRIIATAAIRGAHKIVERAEEQLGKSMEELGADKIIDLPDTAYYLPVIYAMLGLKVQKVGDLQEVIQHCKNLLPPIPTDGLWLPYLGSALDAGMATLFAQEVLEGLKYAHNPNPYNDIWLGATSDAILREQGIKLVDGRMPGFAACVGALPTTEAAVKLARDLQERNILVFLSSSTNGVSMAEQLAEANVEMNWDTFLVPYGKDTSATVWALGFAARSAMTFGGLTPGGLKEARDILLYNKERVHAFVLALGEVDDEKYATAAGAINFGFPVIADTDIPEILPTGICTYEHVVSNISHDDMPSRAIQVRGVKIKIQKIDIPVRYGPAFEGERVRKDDLQVEFGGKYHTAFEYLSMKQLDEVEDGKIEVIGPEISEVEEAAKLPIAIWVEVAGRKMQKDFESILERYVHTMLSMPMGVMHLGQRDTIWVRISKTAYNAGFTLKHLGVTLRSMLLNEFPAIVDKVQVKLYTNTEDVERLYQEAKAAYEIRDKRMGELVDEAVDTFYSCQLCQSYAPNHVCIITPERLGLCGAYNWLDGKAAYEINPTGGNQPVAKGDCYDEEKGKWNGVDDFIQSKSNQAVERFSAYSMMDDPMTSCGCFEAITCVLPGTGGIMIVDREFQGMTPAGMTFSSLAEVVGGGQQTPGFIGIGILYVLSKKFISADGGLKRVVWMTSSIKNRLGDKLAERYKEIGEPDLLDKIPDESITDDLEKLAEHLAEVGHPALEMGEMV
ncbi:CO dehydrogenase/CO-methylating acetyl-CoA synthase complex subunit beta [candidate division LCP-89 bacterium B3_LCP]|uniref:CO-methylating acetyl-CoA synthase n=1 Tax=candidate division LCP-89 bacterium B3_LCP TaxID=2012998 RepID=A0A532UPL0_UNCL8|nr:MAG: CO dehydrogenase/CO-methylating acetyl-CoA synthase complex subunit beta [candidate division LCP-89 bacterium B3_LCP]